MESVRFAGSTHELEGRIHRPAGRPVGWALFAHCFTCGKDLNAARRVAEELAAAGFGVLRFDFTGLGRSGGDFADTDFSSDVQDLLAAADFLREHFTAPALLVGHSLGGTAALVAGPQIPECRAIATIGSPSEANHVKHQLPEGEIRAAGVADVQLAGRTFTVRAAFLDDLDDQCVSGCLASADRALLFLHSPHDDTVGVAQARKLFQAARHPKSFVSLDGADHLLSRPADARYAGHVIASWARRYVAPPVEEHRAHRDDVEVRTGRGFGTDVVVNNRHRLRADEPLSAGGEDTGPTPYDLLSAALGACTSMTLRMYADRKQLDLEEVVVHVRHQKIHAADCEVCETQSGRVDRFERTIELVGDLDEAVRARMLQIADRCPVHRTLHNEVSVVTHLAPETDK